jgi:arsenate reductase
VSLARRAAAELAGTALLVAAVVGSGIAAARLSPDPGLRLLENAIATALALGALILTFGPVSGAHFNPLVSAADWWLGGLTSRDLAAYAAAQTAGAVTGAILANLMFHLPPVTVATTNRQGPDLWLAEAVATSGLILLINAMARSGRIAAVPAAVGAYIGAAYWWTSSTSFANPAVTIGRMFSDTFAGIAPAAAPGFILAQAAGAIIACAATAWWFPRTVVTPREEATR